MTAILADGLTGMVVALLLYGALHDFAARTVPNIVPVTIFFMGGALRAVEHNVPLGLLIAAISFVVLLPLWMFGVIGGGDVKLWTAMALVVPPTLSGQVGFLITVFILGGVLALIYLGLRRVVVVPRFVGVRRGSLARRVLRAEAWRISHRGPLPYAMAIAGGGLLTLATPMLGRIGG